MSIDTNTLQRTFTMSIDFCELEQRIRVPGHFLQDPPQCLGVYIGHSYEKLTERNAYICTYRQS